MDSFSFKKGEFILVAGVSGSGKTTLLNGLKDRLGLNAGLVTQNVDEGIVTDKVWHELAFGMENLGCEQAYMRRKLAEMTSFFGLSEVYRRKTSELSGGMKQMVMLASVMSMEPEVLLLDEPTSQLDPIAAEKFLSVVDKLRRELGTTVIIAEHRFSNLLRFADRMVILDEMEIVKDGPVRNVLEWLHDSGHPFYASLPVWIRLYFHLKECSKNSGKRKIWNVQEKDSQGQFLEDFVRSEDLNSYGLVGKQDNSSKENREKRGQLSDDVKESRGVPSQEQAGNKNLDLEMSLLEVPLSLNDCRRYVSEMPDEAKEWLRKEYDWNRTGIDTENNKKTDIGSESGKTSTIDVEKWKTLVEDTGNGKKSCPAVVLRDVGFSYGEKEVLRSLSFSADRGKITALVGGNGSGKTSTLMLIAGMLKDYTGSISYDGKMTAAYLPQNPRLLFLKENIREELEYTAKSWKNVAELCGITHILDRHPYDVSGGEIQRAALAKLLLSSPDILLLDEPTKGMEAAARDELALILKKLAEDGCSIIMASHDLEFAAKYADKTVLLFDGEATAEGGSDDFFGGNTFYTTEGERLLKQKRNLYHGDKNNKITVDLHHPGNSEIEKNTRNRRLKTPIILMLFSVLVLMPLTVLIGSTYLENRKYYFVALLLMLELLVPAYAIFEARKPKAIEIVMMATMCALTVVGRVLFYMLPTIKPVIALVMLSGLSFGPLSGLLVGASSMLVSNIFFGQGPWTPWQMFVMGLIGLLSGLLGRREGFKENLPLVCVTGFLMTLVVFGGIMNPASIIMYEPDFTGEMIKTAYATGLPYDLLSAVFTALFLAAGTRPILKRCERVKRYMD